MPDLNQPAAQADPIDPAAALWLARRDRGLTASEQSAYARWLGENPAHEAAILRLGKVWSALDQLAAHPAAADANANPDLLAPQRGWSRWAWVPLVAAAAAVTFIYFAGRPSAVSPNAANAPRAILHPGAERLTLEDGSVVELHDHARVEVQFSPAERRVRLVSGEAYFTVAKNPHRPFIVSANQVTVVAVGTAFSVGLDQRDISVLVTEGRVRVEEVLLPSGEKAATPRELSALVAGQQGFITVSAGQDGVSRSEMKITEFSPAQIERALAWQGQRLEFFAMPLQEVAAEFNRYNHKKLVVHDADTGAIVVGGNFRVDNVDAFVRLLDSSFGVSAFPHGDEIILRKTHQP